MAEMRGWGGLIDVCFLICFLDGWIEMDELDVTCLSRCRFSVLFPSPSFPFPPGPSSGFLILS
jgi:hypothetical protein